MRGVQALGAQEHAQRTRSLAIVREFEDVDLVLGTELPSVCFRIHLDLSNGICLCLGHPGQDGNLWFTESNAGKIGRITP
jgi:hypothetical protein